MLAIGRGGRTDHEPSQRRTVLSTPTANTIVGSGAVPTPLRGTARYFATPGKCRSVTTVLSPRAIEMTFPA